MLAVLVRLETRGKEIESGFGLPLISTSSSAVWGYVVAKARTPSRARYVDAAKDDRFILRMCHKTEAENASKDHGLLSGTWYIRLLHDNKILSRGRVRTL